MGYGWLKRGDLVRVLHPYGAPGDPPIGVNEDPNLGIVLRTFEPVAYQRASYDVLLDGRVITVEHSYLVHVGASERPSNRGSGLDSPSPRAIGQPGDCDGSVAAQPGRPVS